MSVRWQKSGFLAIALLTALILYATQDRWRLFISNSQSQASTIDHSGPVHSETAATKWLTISDSARTSLGLEMAPIALQEYWRSVPIPAEIMEEPGHCEQGVSSSVHGVVLKIHAFHGQTVRAADPLFDVRPTSELLAATQTSLLKAVQEIELITTEIARIQPLVEKGNIPRTNLIEKQNEQSRNETQRLLCMQELLVRGLSAEQIDEIVRSKTLIRELTIRAPQGTPMGAGAEPHSTVTKNESDHDNHVHAQTDIAASNTKHEHGSVYSVEQMTVHLGKLIQPGEELCRLARHSQLLIVGRAFERENLLMNRAIERNWPVVAIFEATDEQASIRKDLSILYADNVIESDSRTIRFYIRLSNELLRDQPAANGLSYRSWRFKPGQRAKILLPVEHLLNQIVLPAEAIAKEGSETFVFRANGSRLDRVPVRLSYLDSRDAVIEKRGKLAVGDVIVRNQAFQLELALKNSQSSTGGGHSHGGHDHAGHDHGHEH